MNLTYRLPPTLRILITSAALLAASSASFAQDTASAPAPSAPSDKDKDKKDETVIMSAFEVSSTEGKGYTSSNAATGFKTNEQLLKIPQAVTVVTRDLINDIGAVDGSNILRFAGEAKDEIGRAHV